MHDIRNKPAQAPTIIRRTKPKELDPVKKETKENVSGNLMIRIKEGDLITIGNDIVIELKENDGSYSLLRVNAPKSLWIAKTKVRQSKIVD